MLHASLHDRLGAPLIYSARDFDCFAQERVISNLAEYGNTSAASIPLALDEAVRAGSIKQGDVVRRTHRNADLPALSTHAQFLVVPCSKDPSDMQHWLSSIFHVVQIAMAGFGAGLTWASAIVKWG